MVEQHFLRKRVGKKLCQHGTLGILPGFLLNIVIDLLFLFCYIFGVSLLQTLRYCVTIVLQTVEK